jgi:hypothetical protein
MAFALREQARLLLVRLSADRRNDAAGFTSCCGLVSCSAPLRTRPLDHARGLRYRGPWRLPGPDLHRLAALSLSLGYVTTTSLSSWRPNCWTHPPIAGKRPGPRPEAFPTWTSGDGQLRRLGQARQEQFLKRMCTPVVDGNDTGPGTSRRTTSRPKPERCRPHKTGATLTSCGASRWLRRCLWFTRSPRSLPLRLVGAT